MSAALRIGARVAICADDVSGWGRGLRFGAEPRFGRALQLNYLRPPHCWYAMSHPHENVPNPEIGTDRLLQHRPITTILTCFICLSRYRSVPTAVRPESSVDRCI
jgi:hypothetical protein